MTSIPAMQISAHTHTHTYIHIHTERASHGAKQLFQILGVFQATLLFLGIHNTDAICLYRCIHIDTSMTFEMNKLKNIHVQTHAYAPMYM